jgi:hypothetical protein
MSLLNFHTIQILTSTFCTIQCISRLINVTDCNNARWKPEIMCVGLYFCLRYPACKSHLYCAILYCNLWPVWHYHIVPHYLINGTIYGKKCTEHKTCVLISATTIVLKIFLSEKNSETYYRTCSQLVK